MKFYDINGLEKTDLQVIQDTGWIELNADIKYRKVNGIVYITGIRNKVEMASGYNIVGTLPQGFKPTTDIYAPLATIGYTDSGNGIFIEKTGTIYVYQNVARTINYSISVSYPI